MFRLELSPSILELCDRAATKVVWVTVSVAARSANKYCNTSHRKKIDYSSERWQLDERDLVTACEVSPALALLGGVTLVASPAR